MPGLCVPIEDGGIGFDYRLNMYIPDLWIKLLKDSQDENWDISHIVYCLRNRRWNEKHISYCESHDQSIVGDKTISHWLFDAEIYDNMSILIPPTIVVDRGMSLHKMIRLLTISIGGEGYLNFIGNEFGHPEWVDFPREGNGYSYHHCRRQWNLADNELLRYRDLLSFDNQMIETVSKYKYILSDHEFISKTCNKDKVIIFEKGVLLFIFNFHPSNCYEDYQVPTQFSQIHTVVYSTEDKLSGGKGRISHISYTVTPEKEKFQERDFSFKIYLPNRSAVVLKSGF